MTEPTVAPPGGDQRRRLLLLVGGGVAVLVLLLVVLRLVTGGGDEAPTTTATTRPPGSAPATTTTTALGPGPAETFEVFTTKNPFLPLRSPAGGAAPAGTAGTTTGGAPGGPGAAAGATGGGTAAGARAGTGAQGGGTQPRRGARVALQDVFTEGGRTMANVRVNDTVHKVASGQTFATNFKVVALSQSDRCGRFLFGDDSFRLCRGEEVLK